MAIRVVMKKSAITPPGCLEDKKAVNVSLA